MSTSEGLRKRKDGAKAAAVAPKEAPEQEAAGGLLDVKLVFLVVGLWATFTMFGMAQEALTRESRAARRRPRAGRHGTEASGVRLRRAVCACGGLRARQGCRCGARRRRVLAPAGLRLTRAALRFGRHRVRRRRVQGRRGGRGGRVQEEVHVQLHVVPGAAAVGGQHLRGKPVQHRSPLPPPPVTLSPAPVPNTPPGFRRPPSLRSSQETPRSLSSAGTRSRSEE